ncbi:hypothetical protein Tco_0376851 [Tanacetum coccineum]
MQLLMRNTGFHPLKPLGQVDRSFFLEVWLSSPFRVIARAAKTAPSSIMACSWALVTEVVVVGSVTGGGVVVTGGGVAVTGLDLWGSSGDWP